MYDDVTSQLRKAYDRSAHDRQQRPQASWKIDERRAFLELLQKEGNERLLEIGAGPGKDSLYFQNHGLNVISTDLSPQMVELCRAKGLEAYEMDFLNLDFPDSHFDAVYALNCLLHVPKEDLPAVLNAIRRIIEPNGLFFMAVYGGFEHEGIWANDQLEPKRFFAFYSDDQLLKIITRVFQLIDFKRIVIPNASHPDMIVQRLLLRQNE
ncbi:MAG: class I SAM-dependent methyltransferase [Candidatus Promineifilaceae bacterium]|nr:class I SAM-dependent methyltransferase [Candidatus Promineifilaceae bacterium]